MIDKAPETTTLQCQLPKESVDRLVSLAQRRNLTLDEAIGQAIDQSCVWWEVEGVGAQQRPIREISGPIEDSTISPPMTPAHPEGRPVTSIRTTHSREPSWLPDED